ncbi:MAG TPA: hypothetical protein V6D17_21770, partial [Candidatus Obscuribacterales bacterium]
FPQQAPGTQSGGFPQQAPGAQASGFPQQAPGTQSGGFPQQAPGAQASGFPQQAPGAQAGGFPQQEPGAQASGFPQQAPGTQAGGFPQQAPGAQAGGFPQQAPGAQSSALASELPAESQDKELQFSAPPPPQEALDERPSPMASDFAQSSQSPAAWTRRPSVPDAEKPSLSPESKTSFEGGAFESTHPSAWPAPKQLEAREKSVDQEGKNFEEIEELPAKQGLAETFSAAPEEPSPADEDNSAMLDQLKSAIERKLDDILPEEKKLQFSSLAEKANEGSIVQVQDTGTFDPVDFSPHASSAPPLGQQKVDAAAESKAPEPSKPEGKPFFGGEESEASALGGRPQADGSGTSAEKRIADEVEKKSADHPAEITSDALRRIASAMAANKGQAAEGQAPEPPEQKPAHPPAYAETPALPEPTPGKDPSALSRLLKASQEAKPSEPAAPPADDRASSAVSRLLQSGAHPQQLGAPTNPAGASNAAASPKADIVAASSDDKISSAVSRLLQAARKTGEVDVSSFQNTASGAQPRQAPPASPQTSSASISSADIDAAARRLSSAAGDMGGMTSDLVNRFMEAANRGSEMKKRAHDAYTSKGQAIDQELTGTKTPPIPTQEIAPAASTSQSAQRLPTMETKIPGNISEQTQNRLKEALERVGTPKPPPLQDAGVSRSPDLQVANIQRGRAPEAMSINLDEIHKARRKEKEGTRTKMRSAFQDAGPSPATIIAVILAVVVLIGGGYGAYVVILKPKFDQLNKPASGPIPVIQQAQKQFSQGNYTKAIELIDKKQKLTKELSVDEEDLLHHACIKHAEKLAKQTKYTEAKKFLNRVPEDSPHIAKKKELLKKYRRLRR